MEQNEVKEQSAIRVATGHAVAVITPSQEDAGAMPPAKEMPCPTCGGEAAPMPTSYVYALGRIEARFPRLSVEKEFAQATGRAETTGKTDQQAFHAVLSKRENHYLVRQLCWVLTFRVWRPTSYNLAIRRTSISWWKPSVLNPAPWTSMSSSVCVALSPHRSCVMD